MSSLLSELLAHPLTKELSLDDPRTSELRARIIRDKAFLRKLYEEWYGLLVRHIPAGTGRVLEIGSGGGFFKESCPEAIASEVFPISRIDVVFNAMAMPFREDAFRALVLVDVLHHVPEPASFFEQAARCVRVGGRCLLIEPWNTRWARWFYQHLHHEPFDPDAGWTIASSGPLSGANGALPWILFERDRARFHDRFPSWRVSGVVPLMPFVYLLSGGVSLRPIVPGWLYKTMRALERLVPALEQQCGMFAFIAIDRV